MKFYPHKDLELYRKAQVATYKRKSEVRWVLEKELLIIAGVISSKLGVVEFGICHGVRTGFENCMLSELLFAEVVGTDIGNLSSGFVIPMDFHEEVPDWKGKADFVYSNSLDHSHNPSLALQRWFECLKVGGLLVIHWDCKQRERLNAADCFSASEKEYVELLSSFGKVEKVKACKSRVLLVVSKGS